MLVYATVQSRVQSIRNTRPCITGHPVSNPWITCVYKCIVYCVLYTIRFNLTKHSLINILCQVARHYTHGDRYLYKYSAWSLLYFRFQQIVRSIIWKAQFAAKFTPTAIHKKQSEWGLFWRISQTLGAGFSKQNYYEKIDRNQRKNIKNYKNWSARGNLKKKRNVKINIPH